MHFGQKNCTPCALGGICPLEGMLLPQRCPKGMACNKEGSMFPETLCKVGHICLGDVMTATEVKKRSCRLVVQFGEENPCPYGVRFNFNGSFGNSATLLPNYFYK